MKKLIFISLFLLSATGGYAQFKKVTYASKQQVADFFKSKTMIVMDASPVIGYNIIIANAVKKYWKITPYEIITSEQFDEMYTDPGLSFVFLSRLSLEKQKNVYYLYMNVVMGAKVKDITDLPELLSLPLAYTGVDEDNYVDKLPLMVRFAQIHLNKLKGGRFTLKDYNTDAKKLKNKTILVKENDLSEEVNTPEKIRKVYPGKVKIVTSEEMIKAIDGNDPNTAVLHQVGPGEEDGSGRSYRLIFGTDGVLHYYNFQTISQKYPAGMLARDFQWIADKIK
ncbi:MAG: hypothetical protein LBR08_01345 [Bacteroidales bacterium]|jgi:hypothetical protein|nr:hypothetical protein [Bacteroidales bacterium]